MIWGNHSENPQEYVAASVEECKKKCSWCMTRSRKSPAMICFLFRPPYGDYDNEVITTVREMGYYPIQWDVDSLD